MGRSRGEFLSPNFDASSKSGAMGRKMRRTILDRSVAGLPLRGLRDVLLTEAIAIPVAVALVWFLHHVLGIPC